jgi:hypothetical protein
MMFRVVVEEKQNATGMIYVVELPENKPLLKIGRVPECDIKLKDISVSRAHANLYINPPGSAAPFAIEDNASKFGTLVSVPKLKLGVVQTPPIYKTEVPVY